VVSIAVMRPFGIVLATIAACARCATSNSAA